LQEQEAHIATAARPAARRTIEVEWRYITNLHLPLRAAPDFRSQKDPEEQVRTYSFKDNTGRVLTRTGRQRQMGEELREAGRRGGVMLAELNTL